MKISPKNLILAYQQIQRFIKVLKIWKLSNISVFLTHQFNHLLLYDMGIKEAEENYLFLL